MTGATSLEHGEVPAEVLERDMHRATLVMRGNCNIIVFLRWCCNLLLIYQVAGHSNMYKGSCNPVPIFSHHALRSNILSSHSFELSHSLSTAQHSFTTPTSFNSSQTTFGSGHPYRSLFELYQPSNIESSISNRLFLTQITD